MSNKNFDYEGGNKETLFELPQVPNNQKTRKEDFNGIKEAIRLTLTENEILAFFTRNADKLIANDTSSGAPGAYIGREYKGPQYYGYAAQGEIKIGANAYGNQYYGRSANGTQYYSLNANANQYYGQYASEGQYYGDSARGEIEIGSQADNQTDESKQKMKARASDGSLLEATFANIIRKTNSVELATNMSNLDNDLTDTEKSTIKTKIGITNVENPFTQNSDKLVANDTSLNPGNAHIGDAYDGAQFYGKDASDQSYGWRARGHQYYGREASEPQFYGWHATGEIEIGSQASNQTDESKQKLVAKASDGSLLEATFADIIRKANESV